MATISHRDNGGKFSGMPAKQGMPKKMYGAAAVQILITFLQYNKKLFFTIWTEDTRSIFLISANYFVCFLCMQTVRMQFLAKAFDKHGDCPWHINVESAAKRFYVHSNDQVSGSQRIVIEMR